MTTTATDTTDLLRVALRTNVALSVTTGATLLVAGPWLDDPLGVPWPLLVALGAGLLVFARLVAVVAGRTEGLVAEARQVIAADAAWVVGATAVVLLDLLPRTGDLALVGVTVLVAAVATAQALGVRRAGG